MKHIVWLLLLALAGCESWSTDRGVTCRTQVEGENVKVTSECDYKSGRESQRVTGPG